jgi:protein kinase A
MLYEVGSFGKVKLVKKKNTNKYSCVKIMKKEELIKSQQVDHISNEYRILSTISHPFIVNVP